MKKVIVFGSGGQAKELIACIELSKLFNVVGVIALQPFNNPKYAAKYKIHSIVPDEFELDPEVGYLFGITDPAIKRKLVAENADKWITYIDPTCQISPYAEIGRGSVFMSQAIVYGDAKVGNFVFFNTNAAVGHDSIIHDYVTLNPNTEVCGNCEIGEDVIFGIGAYAIPNVKIVAGAKVSAGAIVRKSILEPVTVHGDPAKPRDPT